MVYKCFVCMVLLAGIIVKAGAGCSNIVLCNIVGDRTKADDLNLIDEQYLKYAVAQLINKQLLNGIKLGCIGESDVFHLKFIEKRLKVLIGQALLETKSSLQASKGITDAEKRITIYQNQGALVVDP